MNTVTTGQSSGQPSPDHRPAVARSVLVAGGGFATTAATVLGIAGNYNLGDRPTLYGLGAVCVIAALTMFFAAYLMRREI